MDVGEHPTLPLIALQSQPESLLHLFLLTVHGPHLPPFFLFSQPQPRRTQSSSDVAVQAFMLPEYVIRPGSVPSVSKLPKPVTTATEARRRASFILGSNWG